MATPGHGREPALLNQLRMKKVGRNDACPCGSGRKFKRCCMQLEGAPRASERFTEEFIHKAMQTALEHHQAGRLAEEMTIYQQILQIAPKHPDALRMLDVIAEQIRRDEMAIDLLSKAITTNPSDPDFYNQLGIALQDQGRLDEALGCYQKALSLRPDFAEAHGNLGDVLNDLGQVDAALARYRRALELKDAPEFRTGFAQCIRNCDLTQVDEGIRRLVARAVSEPWARPGDLADTSIYLITRDRSIRDCVERAVSAWPRRLSGEELFGPSGLNALSDDALLRALLESAPVCDIELERLLTMVRYALLDVIRTDRRDDLDDKTLGFFCAVAQQCFINEFVFSCTGEESDRATSLRDMLVARLDSGEPIPASWVVAVAAYFPLLPLRSVNTLLKRVWPESVTALLAQQVIAPLEERQYRDAMPRLTAVEGSVSHLVQQQYEENPYPKWVKLPRPAKTRSLNFYLRQHFPFARPDPGDNSPDLDILIAGCGTGQEVIEFGQQFPSARVLAVDLSLSSLCYARRKTQELGVGNVEYAQADIMNLGSIGRTFDIIASVGVLHHLADPMAGWRQLLSLLRPGGFMRLGLYSERARQTIVAARKFISEHGYRATADDIRRCRQDLLSLEKGAPFKPLTLLRDFFVTSGCRDLLFHVQEHRFTLPQINEAIGNFGLNLVEFSLAPRVIKRYTERFPDDKARTNLDYWNQFETEFPDTFAGMYMFWLQKPRA